MNIKNIEELTNITLDLLYDLSGHKTKEKVIELLQTQIFAKIEKENFQKIYNHIKSNVNNLPDNEILIFEEALEIFLRNFFDIRTDDEIKHLDIFDFFKTLCVNKGLKYEQK